MCQFTSHLWCEWRKNPNGNGGIFQEGAFLVGDGENHADTKPLTTPAPSQNTSLCRIGEREMTKFKNWFYNVLMQRSFFDRETQNYLTWNDYIVNLWVSLIINPHLPFLTKKKIALKNLLQIQWVIWILMGEWALKQMRWIRVQMLLTNMVATLPRINYGGNNKKQVSI